MKSIQFTTLLIFASLNVATPLLAETATSSQHHQLITNQEKLTQEVQSLRNEVIQLRAEILGLTAALGLESGKKLSVTQALENVELDRIFENSRLLIKNGEPGKAAEIIAAFVRENPLHPRVEEAVLGINSAYIRTNETDRQKRIDWFNKYDDWYCSLANERLKAGYVSFTELEGVTSNRNLAWLEKVLAYKPAYDVRTNKVTADLLIRKDEKPAVDKVQVIFEIDNGRVESIRLVEKAQSGENEVNDV